jgi:drug/metabolite transporter (DMT)-like permease
VEEGSDAAVLAALVVGGVLAAGNAIGVRFSLDELAPLWGAGLRFVIAALLLGIVAVVRRHAWPSGRALTGAVLFGLLNFTGAFGFAYYALVHMQAGLASTLLALVPLVTLVLAVLARQESLRLPAVGGGLLAVAGVGLVSRAALDGDVPTLAILAGLASVTCFALGAVAVRHFPRVQAVVMNTVSMAVGGVTLVALALATGEPITLPTQGRTWLAFGYLVVVGSIVVFMLYLYVLGRWSASRAVYFDLLIPPVAVLLSAWLDDEPITGGLVAGGVLILAGVYLGALRPDRGVPTPVVQPAA